MDKQYDKKTRRTWSRHEIHIDLLKKTLKNIELENARPWWNTWVLIPEIYLHSWKTSTRNEQMPTKSKRTRMDYERKEHIDTKGPKQRNCAKQLQTHNLPTDDVENINSTNRGRYWLLANQPQIFPEEQKGCRKGSRGTAELF